jgi:hypothetical protein
VYEYIIKFNYLAQYGTHHVDTDDKKAELFSKELRLPLQDRLVWFRDMSLNALVSSVVDQEGTYRALLAEEEKMRKRVVSGPSKIVPGVLHRSTAQCTLHQLASHDCHLHHHSGIIAHLSSSTCYPRHLSSFFSLYHLMHLSRRL